MKNLFLICAFLLSGSFRAQQQSNAYSLQQAIEYALKNSPNQQNADLDLNSSIYKKNEIRASGLPQITSSVDFKDYLEIPTSLIPAAAFNPFAPADAYSAVKFGVKYNATAGVSASQLLFSADYLFGLKAAQEFVSMSKINIQRNKSELTAQVSKAYYSVLINNERAKLLDANISRLEKSLNDLKAYNKQGLVELIDVERLEVANNNLINEKQKIKQLILLGENLLKFQMGYKINEQIVLTDSLNIDQDLKQELNLSSIDLSKRSDFQLLKTQQSLLDLDVKRLQWGYLPTLAAYGTYQYNSQRATTNFFETDKTNASKQWYPISLIGITMNLTIFDGLQRHNRIQQAKISSRKNINNLRNLELGAQLESSMAAITFNNALKSIENNQRNMELAKHIYDIAEKKYEQGVGSNLELINAQTSLRESEINYYSSVYDAIVARIDYQKATGTLSK